MSSHRHASSLGFDLKALALYTTFPLFQAAAAIGLTVGVAAFGKVKVRVAMLAYLVWAWFIDDSPQRGGYALCRRLGITSYLRRHCWTWGAQYFPMSLRATADLPAEKGPYILACHPHGIFGVSHMTNFGTDATDFSRLFPGLTLHLLGHSAFFRIPLFREWCLMHGHGSVDKRSMLHLLRKGHSVALAIGGAKESLECVTGTMRLFLANRRGFAKIALQTGAALVPVIAFGENDLYTTVQFQPGSRRRRLQEALQKRMGFALPMFCGLTLAPWLPKRLPTTTVVGPPVRPPSQFTGAEPSQDAVKALHLQYCEALRQLFDAHKADHGAANVELEIV